MHMYIYIYSNYEPMSDHAIHSNEVSDLTTSIQVHIIEGNGWQ